MPLALYQPAHWKMRRRWPSKLREPTFSLSSEESEKLPSERDALAAGQKYVRGIFSGGTLAIEAAMILGDQLGDVHTNTSLDFANGLAGC